MRVVFGSSFSCILKSFRAGRLCERGPFSGQSLFGEFTVRACGVVFGCILVLAETGKQFFGYQRVISSVVSELPVESNLFRG